MHIIFRHARLSDLDLIAGAFVTVVGGVEVGRVLDAVAAGRGLHDDLGVAQLALLVEDRDECLISRSAGEIGAVFGSDVAQSCVTTTPVSDSSSFSFNYLNGQQLIVLIRPHRPGVVVIHGFQVSYRDGLRRGTQLTGINIKVQARSH